MLGDEHHQAADLSLELCLGRPKGFGQSRRGGEHHKHAVTDTVADDCARTARGCRDAKDMIMVGDVATGEQIELGLDNHRTELYLASRSGGGLREEDDTTDFPERWWKMSVKTATSVEMAIAGYVPPYSSASFSRESFSDQARCLSNAHDDSWRKNAVYQQHVVDQQREKEMHLQKPQVARKKRKMLTGEQNFQKLQLQKSRPFLGYSTHSESSVCTQKPVEQVNVLEFQKEGASEGLLERTSSEVSFESQTLKIEWKQPILREQRAHSDENIHLVDLQRERDTAATDKELVFGFRPNEDLEPILRRQSSTNQKSSHLTEEQNKLETARYIQKFHDLRKMMSSNVPSVTENITRASVMTSDFSVDASQTNYRNADQVDILIGKAGIYLASARDKCLKSKDLKSLKDQSSTKDKTNDSPTIRLEEVASITALSEPLPTNAASFIPIPCSFPPRASNNGGLSYPVPYFMPYVVAQPPLGSQSENPFTSYQLSIPPGSTPIHMTTLEETASTGTLVLQPTLVKHPPISRTRQRKSPGRSREKEQKCSQGGATVLRTKTPPFGVSPKPPLPGAISSELKGRNWLDHAHSHAFSGTSSGIQEEVAASGPSHSGISSSSGGLYQSAHGETVESDPTRNAAEMNFQAIKESSQETTTETDGAAAPAGLSSNDDRPFVSTTANGKTINGVLYRYTESEVKIRCKCHGKCMNAREFVVHAGGVDGPHPERSILVKPSTNELPVVHC